jgi:hypothetical protein
VVIEKLNKLTLSYSVLIQEHPGRRLLDFGGGTGVFCEIAHELGRYVTYLDIPGLVSEFARWRFWEYQSQSECRSRHRKIRLSSAVRRLYFDAVPEHLPGRSRSSWWTTCAELCSTGGLLILYLPDLSSRADPTHS